MKAKLRQRLDEIKGLRTNLVESQNVASLMSHLNYSLQQYDQILDDKETFALPEQPKKHSSSQQRPQSQVRAEMSPFLDPYIVIDKTKKARNKKQKDNSISFLPEMLDQLVEQKKKISLRIAKPPGSIKKGMINSPKLLLPKQLRYNPFAHIQAIHEDQISEGMINLINKGIIQRDVDISPAFEKGSQILQMKQLEQEKYHFMRRIHDMSEKKLKYYIPLKQQNPCLIKLSNLPAAPDKSHRINSVKVTRQEKQLTPVENAKNLNQQDLIEIFQVHQIEIIKSLLIAKYFVKGEIVTNIQLFRLTYLQYWGLIENVFQKLKTLLKQHNIVKVTVNGKKAAHLAIHSQLYKFKFEHLVGCIVQKDIQKQIMTNIHRSNYCVIIQSNVRGFLARMNYRKTLFLIKKVLLIQKFLRKWVIIKRVRKQMTNSRRERLARWQKVAQEFVNNWNQIKFGVRIELHLSSDLTKEAQFSSEHNLQIGRIFRLHDPLIQVIYISKFPIPDDIQNYYYKILELGAIQQSRNRLVFLSSNTPVHLSSLFKNLRANIKGKDTFIIPSSDLKGGIELGQWLGVPVMGSPIQDFRQILAKIDVPVPPGSGPIGSYKELLNSLSLLIMHNPEIRVWLLKVKGYTIGQLPISDFPRIIIILQQQKTDETIFNTILKELEIDFFRKLKVSMKVYKFLELFFQKKGHIEAYPPVKSETLGLPSVMLFLDPQNEIEVLGSYDRLQLEEFRNYGCCKQINQMYPAFPQKSIKKLDLKQLATIVNEGLLATNFYGYITIDMVTFPNPTNPSEIIFQVVDMDFHATVYMSNHFYFHFLMEGQMNQVNGDYMCKLYEQQEAISQPRHYLFLPYFFHQNLLKVTINSFFKMCRLEGISFDLEQKQGTTYILVDSVENGVVGLMTITSNTQACKLIAINAINFVFKYQVQEQVAVNDVYKRMALEIKQFVQKLKSLN